MNNTVRLTLAELKAKADQSDVVENLEAIRGGGLFNCHGKLGAFGKKLGHWIIDKVAIEDGSPTPSIL